MKHNVGKVILGVVSTLLLTLLIKGPEVSARDLRTKAEIEATKDFGYEYEYIPVGTKEELIAVLGKGIEPQNMIEGKVIKGTYIYLTNDIDMAGVNWVPSSICGVFDGNGHIIRNLTVHRLQTDSTAGGGLFSRVHLGTVIRNIGLESVNITSENANAGGLVGDIGDTGWVCKSPILIENCFVTGKVTAKYYAGGLIGTSETNEGSEPVTIKQCMVDVVVSRDKDIYTASGGIIGTQISSGKDIIKDCLIWGSEGLNKSYLSGVTGDSSDGHIENCIIASPNYCYACFRMDNRNVVKNCYYNEKIEDLGICSLPESMANVHPISSSDINKKESYTGLDFNSIWGIDPAINNGTIFLRTIPFAYALSPIQIGSTDNTNGSKQVTINCGAAGATIYYTTDGSAPTTSSQKYTGSFEIWGTKQIQAIAVLGCYKPSPVAALTVQAVEKTDSTTSGASVDGTVTKPKANYTSRTSMRNLKVKLSTSTKGATIYYTTNGKKPTTSSKKYTKAITIKKNTTLKLIAVKNGYATSKVATYKYKIIKPKVSSQTYNKTKTRKKVKLSCALSKTTIYYTTNGKKPTKSSKKYNAKKGIILTKNTTIKYIAVRGKQISDICSTKIYYRVPTPKASKQSSTVKKGTKITLSTSLNGARIYYTTNGKIPSKKSKIYTKAFEINQDMKLQYIAVKKGIKSSKVGIITYQVK